MYLNFIESKLVLAEVFMMFSWCLTSSLMTWLGYKNIVYEWVVHTYVRIFVRKNKQAEKENASAVEQGCHESLQGFYKSVI